MDKQKDVRRHIAAAKGWLKKADASLEQENDIQGDLKLMLAHAELQRAQEKNAQKLYVRWFKRLAPPVVACLLALAGIIYIQGGQEPKAEKAVGDSLPVQAAAAPEMILPQASTDTEAYADSQDTVNMQELPRSYVPIVEAENIDTYEASNDNDKTKQSQQEPEVPAQELQKLMQSAGSVLRE